MSYLGSGGYSGGGVVASRLYSGDSGLESIALYAVAEPVSSSILGSPMPSIHTSSPLEYLSETATTYTSSQSTLYEVHHSSHQEYSFEPDRFLVPDITQPFIGEAEEISEFIEEAFQATVQEPFPSDLSIRICSEKEFHKIAPPGVIGFSINRKELGKSSEIVVKSGSLGRVMLTVGHEIGHVMTRTLQDKHNEEAKAFAFSFAWMKKIKEHNIANLEDAIVLERPADNGLHDVAHSFVRKFMNRGKEAMDIFNDLIRGDVGVRG